MEEGPSGDGDGDGAGAGENSSCRIKRVEVVRVMLQCLYSLGYFKAATSLERESGLSLDSPEFKTLISHALAGRWDDCVSAVDGLLGGTDSRVRQAAAFLVWRQHVLELLDSGGGGIVPAIDVLRDHIAPLEVDRRCVHGLTRALVSPQERSVVPLIDDLVRRRLGLVMDLLEVFPPWVQVPSGRLVHLLETAVLHQANSCAYHNSPAELTLYEDHLCTLDHIPSRCGQILYEHKNEVWFVQFSNKGEYLASSSRDCTAIIWTVREDDTLLVKFTLEGHMKPVAYISWSPDDSMLLTCGNGEVLKLWDVNSGTCKITFSSPSNHIVSSCAWFPNSKKIVCGSYEPDNRIFTLDTEGNELEVWEGQRIPKVSDLAVTPDGRCLVSVCSNREILVREFDTGKERIIPEKHSITSLALSRNGQFMIVNLNSQEIHMWDFCEASNAPNKYKGHKQEKYVIRSCFGGSDCLFIASGSEDSQVYIWHRRRQTPIQILRGHETTVNCVSWNPTKHYMVASASDDRTVRIWVAERKFSESN